MPRRSIQLDRVTFQYQNSSTEVLRAISMTIPVGSRIALVGRTGSGKTTIAHILLGCINQPQASCASMGWL